MFDFTPKNDKEREILSTAKSVEFIGCPALGFKDVVPTGYEIRDNGNGHVTIITKY